MFALLKAFAALLPIVKPLVVEIVKAIAGSNEQEDTAKCLLNEARRLRDFDRRMGRRS
jgi:hypothetical protein